MRILQTLKPYSLLILLFFVGLFLRVYQLPSIPVGVHGDEASIGYNAYSFLKTGRDQNSNFLPLSINQFGDFRPAGYHYLDIPFVAVFGLTETAVRLPSALFGAFTLIVFYFLTFELFQNKNISLLSTLLLTLSPWHIIISRSTSEGVIATFFIIFGCYAFIKGLKREKQFFLLISFLLFFISFLFYHSVRFFVPLFLLFFIPTCFSVFKPSFYIKKKVCIFSVITFCSLLILLYVGRGGNRPLDVSILNVPGGNKEVLRQQDEDGRQTPLLTRFFHNKIYFYTRIFSESYFQHFSGDFLFTYNGFPVRYQVPWSGNLYPFQLPFLLIGCAVLLTEGLKQKKYLFLIPIIWLFLGGLPAGLTWEDIPNIQRSSLMLYPIVLITAFGLHETCMLLKKNIRSMFLIAVGLFFTQNGILFLHNYFYHTKTHEPWHRSIASKELSLTINNLSKQYSKIVMTTDHNNNFILYLFYTKFDPFVFQKMGSPQEKDGLHFKNIVYTNTACAIEGNPQLKAVNSPHTLFVNTAKCTLPLNAEILQTIRTPDGTPTFEIIRLKEE